MGVWIQDVSSENKNEDIESAIALSLAGGNDNGNNVNGEWYNFQALLPILEGTTCMPVPFFIKKNLSLGSVWFTPDDI